MRSIRRVPGIVAAGVGDRAVSYGHRVSQLAARHPDQTAIRVVGREGSESEISWRELDLASNRWARLLRRRDVGQRSTVVVALPNSLEHYLATLAAWKLGACVVTLSHRLRPEERDPILSVARPAAVVGLWEDLAEPTLSPREMAEVDGVSADPLPEVVPRPGKAVASGGSTGRPKVVVDPRPWAETPGRLAELLGPPIGFSTGQIQLVAGPLYHNAPFAASHWGLFEAHTLVVMERFDAGRWVALVERHRVEFGVLVATMMRRILQVPDLDPRRFSSIRSIYHTGGSLPRWVMREWIDLLGPERIYDAYGSTENMGSTSIRGDEWLRHPGSVGRPFDCEVRILDGKGRPVPAGETGEIWTRPLSDEPTYEYLGADPASTTEDGFVTVGDLGWLDEDGFLYVADRRTDLIISGGVNVYPAEVEAILLSHPGVADAVVIGLPDPEWGRRVHALVQPRDADSPFDFEELEAFVRRRVSGAKVPKSWEGVSALPRNEAGKIRRSALVAAREENVG